MVAATQSVAKKNAAKKAKAPRRRGALSRLGCLLQAGVRTADGLKSIPVMIRFERAFRLDADVLGLVGTQLGQLDADLGEVQPGHLLVE